MIKTSKTSSHWNYFLAIERDLDVLSRYVEFHDDNFETYSLEIARILLAAGAEADVVCKQLYAVAGDTNILVHQKELLAAFPNFPKFGVQIPQFGMDLEPWSNWTTPNTPPDWWTAYNKTKHQRHQFFASANLHNALNAVAGLFVVVLYLYRDKAESGELQPNPVLLRPADAHIVAINGDTGAACIGFP